MLNTHPQYRVNEPGARVSTRLVDLFNYRELTGNLVRKELRVKYKNSVLGFFWSLLNPALYLGIFWVVFATFLRFGVPNFAIYLLSGLLAWNLFNGALNGSVTSLIANASLVTKVYFPREVLPISSIGASLTHFFFQFLVLLGALLVVRYPLTTDALILVPAALATELLLLLGASLLVSVLNVYFRDVEHLLELVLLAWFWMTPIVYPIAFVAENIGPGLRRLYMLNPMTSIVLAFQRGIYGTPTVVDPDGTIHRVLVEAPVSWYLRNLGLVALGSLVVLAIGWATFQRLESRLAEEL